MIRKRVRNSSLRVDEGKAFGEEGEWRGKVG